MSDRLFLDTGYAIARFNRRDQHHAAAKRLSSVIAQCRELWTTDAVLFEICAAFSSPGHRGLAVALWDQFHGEDSRYQVVETIGAVRSEGMQLFRSHHDKSWSLTDCVSFVVMREQGLTEALTADRHFDQVRFRALMRVA